jgi:hypothetical protein
LARGRVNRQEAREHTRLDFVQGRAGPAAEIAHDFRVTIEVKDELSIRLRERPQPDAGSREQQGFHD